MVVFFKCHAIFASICVNLKLHRTWGRALRGRSGVKGKEGQLCLLAFCSSADVGQCPYPTPTPSHLAYVWTEQTPGLQVFPSDTYCHPNVQALSPRGNTVRSISTADLAVRSEDTPGGLVPGRTLGLAAAWLSLCDPTGFLWLFP